MKPRGHSLNYLELNIYIYIYIYIYDRPFDVVGRVWVSISGRVIPKTKKVVLDTSLLTTQHYKVRIKGKVKQSRERNIDLPYTSG